MTALFRTAGASGALFEMSGVVSNNVTWDENINFTENGTAMVLTGLSFQFQFRDAQDDTSTVLTLSTADSELVITADDGGVNSILRINVAYTVIDGLEGDYIADLVGKDAASKLTHWAHGVVTFRHDPLAF